MPSRHPGPRLETFALEVGLKGGTLTSRPRPRRASSSTELSLIGLAQERDAGVGSGPGALLGPEGSSLLETSVTRASDAHKASEAPPRVDHDPVERLLPAGARGEPDRGTARSLRTAQWTRASLWPSF